MKSRSEETNMNQAERERGIIEQQKGNQQTEANIGSSVGDILHDIFVSGSKRRKPNLSV